jgi:hypothetical protein
MPAPSSATTPKASNQAPHRNDSGGDGVAANGPLRLEVMRRADVKDATAYITAKKSSVNGRDVITPR